MLRLIARSGAPSPVGGMNRLDTQHANAISIISQAKWIGLLLPLAAMPATMVPSRMARKVPPSISALPDGSSRRARMVGQDAVFDRPEQRRDHAEQKHRDEQQDQRMERKARDRNAGDADLGELEALGDEGFVVAVGELAAEPGEEEERRDQRRAGERDQGRGIGAGHLNRMTKTSAVLRKLSLKAAKNWHQNSGAKRRVVIRDVDMSLSPLALAPALLCFLAGGLFRSLTSEGSLDAGARLGDASQNHPYNHIVS